MGNSSSSLLAPSSPPTPSTPNPGSQRGSVASARNVPQSMRSSKDQPFFGSLLQTPLPASEWEEASKSSATGNVKKIPAMFTWNQGGHDVAITGSFNDWKDTIPMTRSTNDFAAVVNLPVGTHKIRFLVDGQWKCSQDLPTVLEPNGNLVNYIEVSPSELMDFNIYESEEVTQNTVKEEFSQNVPKVGMKEQEPPMLPPQLNKVILNTETLNPSDPSQLPTPHPVMLNHLYALSIKDKIMVLATTSRFKQKYVTTILYKPVVM